MLTKVFALSLLYKNYNPNVSVLVGTYCKILLKVTDGFLNFCCYSRIFKSPKMYLLKYDTIVAAKHDLHVLCLMLNNLDTTPVWKEFYQRQKSFFWCYCTKCICLLFFSFVILHRKKCFLISQCS